MCDCSLGKAKNNSQIHGFLTSWHLLSSEQRKILVFCVVAGKGEEQR